jgi:hypothetical protein
MADPVWSKNPNACFPRHVLNEYVDHYHHERNHHVLLFPSSSQKHLRAGPMQCRERLGGLLKYYTCEAA